MTGYLISARPSLNFSSSLRVSLSLSHSQSISLFLMSIAQHFLNIFSIIPFRSFPSHYSPLGTRSTFHRYITRLIHPNTYSYLFSLALYIKGELLFNEKPRTLRFLASSVFSFGSMSQFCSSYLTFVLHITNDFCIHVFIALSWIWADLICSLHTSVLFCEHSFSEKGFVLILLLHSH